MLRRMLRPFAGMQLKNPGRLAISLYRTFLDKRPVELIAPGCNAAKAGKIRYRKVIIGMFRANVSSSFLDLYLYSALKNAGVNVKVILCDGSTFPCDAIAADGNIFNYRCMECKSTQQRFSTLIDSADIIRPRRITALSVKAPNRNVIASAKRFDKMESGFDEKIAAKYQNTYDSVIDLLKDQRDVDLIIMSHGMYASWGAMRDYCQDRGIDFITWGRSYFDKMIAVVKNSTINEGVNDLYADLPIAHPEELEKLVGSLTSRVSGNKAKNDTVDYYAYLGDRASEPETTLDRISSSAGKTVAIYLSIPWDGTVYGANGEFGSQKDFIRCILNSARMRADILFVFRVHPMEHAEKEKAIDQIRALAGDELPNVVVVDSHAKLTSYQLMKVAQLNIVYSGTLALEIAYAGFPLVVCGRNLSSNFSGITTASTAEEIESIWSSDFSTHAPRDVKTLLTNLSKTLYVDDLTVSDTFDVTSFKQDSHLVQRVMDELIYE